MFRWCEQYCLSVKLIMVYRGRIAGLLSAGALSLLLLARGRKTRRRNAFVQHKAAQLKSAGLAPASNVRKRNEAQPKRDRKNINFARQKCI